MKHSYVPSEFGIGITIPLLKDNNLDGSNMDNYRAITISPVLSKIFENCLLSRFSSYFVTSDLQCGFKFTRLSNRFDNRFDNRFYRVNGA